jgi:hypothetical protein
VGGVLDQIALGGLPAVLLAAAGLVDGVHRRVAGVVRHDAADLRRLGGRGRLLLGHELLVRVARAGRLGVRAPVVAALATLRLGLRQRGRRDGRARRLERRRVGLVAERLFLGGHTAGIPDARDRRRPRSGS